MSEGAGHRLLAIVTDSLDGSQPIEEIRRAGNGNGDGAVVRLVVPAVEASSFRHTLGDIDGPKEEARERLKTSLKRLEEAGISASGEVGDPDPVQAAQDALLKAPADEIVIFERESDQARWFEEGLFERAKASLEPPLRMVVLHTGESAGEQVVAVEEAGAGTTEEEEDELATSENMPGFSSRDLRGIVIAIVGTLVAAVLAAVAASGAGPEAGWKAVAIGVAGGIALINMAHVVGLTLFESVHYRGGFAKFFRMLSSVGTPAAVLVNLAIVLFA
jgi:hypothetical protein